MIILDSTKRSLQISLASAVQNNQLHFSASYIDMNTASSTPGSDSGVTNGANPVTLVAAPTYSTQRQVKSFSVQNADNASAKVSIIYNDNGNQRNIFVATLNAGDNLNPGQNVWIYEAEVGFRQTLFGTISTNNLALDLWGERLGGALVAIGNAPTALFHLLELLDAGAPLPAAVIGLPVGFVCAAESKAALVADGRVPFLIVEGRRGGSAMAVSAVNALASEAE